MQGAQLEKAINSDSSTRLIYQSISAFAQTPAISLCAAARAGMSSSAAAGQQEACLCSSQGSCTSLENRNIHQTQLAAMITTIILIDATEILASGSQMCLWKGRSLQSNTAGAFPKRGVSVSQTHPEGQQEGLTISNEVLGDVERHLDGQRAGELGAAHHGQDAGADRDQRQRRLVHRALHGTCKAHRGWVGGQKGKLYPGISQQRQGAPAWEGSIENEDGSSAGVCTRQDSHHTLFGTGLRLLGQGENLLKALCIEPLPGSFSPESLITPAVLPC